MRRCLSNLLRWGAHAAAAVLTVGCVVSPQPEPPVHEPPVIDVARISLGAREGGVVLAGAAGAVTPGGGELRTLDLDAALPEASVEVLADGSFEAALEGAAEDTFRLQAFVGALRSAPIDVTGVTGIVPGDTVAVVEGPLSGCLRLDPALEIGPLAAGGDAALTLVNGCADEVAVSGLRLRMSSPAWTIAPGAPLAVPPGEERSLTVGFDPAPGDPGDDVLFVEIAAPEAGRRPLTLRGLAP